MHRRTGIVTEKISYVIISPVRDEERYIQKTLESVTAQSLKPAEWIIVDDGSTDRTPEIVTKYAEKYSWIKIICRKNSAGRWGVVDAFEDGYSVLVCKDFDYIVKLDGDVSFDSSYFEKLFQKFCSNPKLGIVGGKGYEKSLNRWVEIKNSEGHVCGATKIYRKKCFEKIGGLTKSWYWDSIDELKAEMLGWQTVTLEDAVFFHQRPEGSRDGLIKGRIEAGRASYTIGYHPLFAIARGLWRMFKPPYFIGGLCLILGYLEASFKKVKQIEDPCLREYLRKKQLTRLKQILKLFKNISKKE